MYRSNVFMLFAVLLQSCRAQSCTDYDLRLVGGLVPNEGRVEICVNQQWGTVCDDLWGDADAAVVCRQLGYPPENANAFSRAHFGEGSGEIFLDNVGCSGSESRLIDCSHPAVGFENCGHHEDASVHCAACHNGEIRLVGGALDWEGRVEVCVNNEWSTVCDDSWQTPDANVACRQLGYSRHNAIAYRIAHFGQGNGPIGLDNVACSGSERRLVDCSYDSNTNDCTHSEDAGIRCQPELLCEDGAIRVRDGLTPYEGRVEVCFNETWGTVCNDFWQSIDASVACRQLGLSSQNAVAYQRPGSTTYSQGSGPIFLDNVGCNGGESRLVDCFFDNHTADCSHVEDAGVKCQPHNLCQAGDIRLAGSSIPGSGRVEVCVNGLWGTVCDDGWGQTDASVVCKQLNYSRHNATAFSQAHFGPGSVPILMRYVGCSGSEEQLTNCSFSRQAAACSHSEDAGVQCQIDLFCRNGDIRITGGTADERNVGRVEVCFNETWGTVCNDDWNRNDAIVACRQLGFSTQGAVALTTPGVSGYNQGTGPIFLDNTICDGSESRLIDCTYDNHTADCRHSEDAGVHCGVMCQTGSIRLVDGQTRREGRVEVCVNQMWGTVCDDLWDAADARVACMQLGYSPTNAIAYAGARFGQGFVPIVLDNVVCQGPETRLIDCSHDAHTADCHHGEDAGVQCQPLCQNGDIRLVGGGSQREGRVEVCVDGGWGTVCADDLWDTTDATVVCRQLGFSRYGAETRSNFDGGSGLIHLNDVRCNGTESGLLNCQYNPSTVGCNHAHDAGLYCRPVNCSNGAVRLVGGLSELEGRVEVCWNETWGTVCDDFWSDEDAEVVCRQLGHTYTDAESFMRAHFGQGSGPILLDNVMCEGSEQSLFSCPHRGIGNQNCLHNEDAGIRCRQCVENSVRLVGGSNQNEGRVEICLSGRWGTVCDDSWGTNDARVVCRQLGHQEQGAQALSSATFGQGTVPIIMTNVMCSGTESQLAGCRHDGAPVQGCSHSEDAGIRCLNVPGSPQTVSVTSLNPSSLTVSWTPPPANQLFGPLLRYNVSCSAQGLSHVYETPNNLTFSRLVNGLYGCISYSCCVSAVSAVGEGSKNCRSATTREDIPSAAPQNLVAYATSSTSISLSWNAPLLEHRNGCIQQYQIYVIERETGRTYHRTLDTSQTATNFQSTIPSLHPYYQYDCRVAAITTGEGPSSQTVTTRTFSSPPTGPPLNIITSKSSRSLSLEWNRPRPEDRNGIITDYVIRVTNIRTSVASESTTSSTSHTMGSLKPCTTYSVVIAARNVNGTGPFSAIYEVQTNEDVPSEPPRSLSLQPSNSTTLRLSWDPPLSENCQIRHYKINITELDTGTMLSLNTTGTSITVPSLHPFYQYRSVVAAFTIGVGPYSSAQIIRLPAGIPSGPPQDFEVTQVSVTSVSLAWNSPRPEHRNGLIIGYVVNVMGGADSYQRTSTATQLTVESLLTYSAYSFAVAARTSVGTGPFSMTITQRTTADIPSKPLDFTVANISGSSTALLLSWSVPEFPNGDIRGYITRITEEQTGRQLEFNSTSLTLTVPQLHPYYIYHCRVAAFNNAGLGLFTPVISGRTPPDVPGLPRGLTVTGSCPPSITLSWSPPLPSEQNGIIIGYRVNARTVERVQMFQRTTTSTSYTILGADPYTTYIFEVAASTVAGQGAFSEAVEIKTCETHATHAPVNITEEERGATSFRISWSPPPEEHHNGVIRHYTVNVTETETQRKLQFTTESTQITVTDLHPYYIYNCSVAAVTVAESPHSANIGVQTREAAPSGPPINLTANTDEQDPNSFVLNWSPPRPEHRNGIIRRYEISIVRADSTQEELRLESYTDNFKVRNLRPYTTYRCKVAAYTLALGPFTAEKEVTTPEAPPTAPPQGVTATPQDPTTLVINWQPPPVEHRNGIIVEYTIRVTEIPTGTLQEFSTGGTAIQLTVHSLHPFYTYAYIVAATTVGQGLFSSSSEIRMPEAAPGAPRNPQHVVRGGTSSELTWEPPRAEDQNGIIRRYVIVLIEVNSTGTQYELEAETTSKLLDFLRPFTEYRYKVAAVTVQIGNYTELRSFTTDTTSPGQVRDLTVEKLDPRTIVLRWLPPLETNGLIQDYVVTVTGLTRTEVSLSYLTTGMTFMVTALHPYHRYLCAVAARTSAGSGPLNTQAVQLPEDNPSGPPLNLTGSPQNSRSFQLSWQAPAPELQNGLLREYKINITELETGRVFPQQTSTVTSFTIQSLHPYYHYNCTVAAYTIAVGPYAAFVIQLPSDVPTSAPVAFVSGLVLPTSVTFSWGPPPAEDRNGLIVQYIIKLVAIKTGETFEVPTESNSTTFVYDNLQPDSAYNCSIAARTDAVGTGPFTRSIPVITPPDVPADAPRVETHMRISATSIRLSWQPLTPEESRGTISMYHVKYRPLNRVTRRSSDDMSIVIDTTNLEVTITDLDPRVAYAVAVAASTSAGMGNYSEEIMIGLYDNSLFQLHLTGAVLCQEWLLTNARLEILDDISQDTARELEGVCSCLLSAKYIGDGRLHCDRNRTDAIVLQARMISTESRDSTSILSTLQQWTRTSPTLVARGVQLRVRADCSVDLEEFDSSLGCVQIPTTPPSTERPMTTQRPTTPPTTPQQPESTDAEGAKAAALPIPAIAGAVGGVIVAVIVVILAVLLCRRQKAKQRRRNMNFSHAATVNPLSAGVYDKPPLPALPAVAGTAGSILETVLNEPIYEPIPGEEGASPVKPKYENHHLPGMPQDSAEHMYNTTSHDTKPANSGYDYATTFRRGTTLPKEASASNKAVANGYSVPRKTGDESQKAPTGGQEYAVLDLDSLPPLQYSAFGPGGAVPNPYEALPTHANPSYGHFDDSSGSDSRQEGQEHSRNEEEYIVMRRRS